MKLYISSVLLGLLTFFPAMIEANTYTDPKTNVVYTYTYGSGEASVEQCYENTNNVSGDVTILKDFKYGQYTYTVTSIGWGAFYDNKKITSVTIPNSVISLSESIFGQCSNLSSIQVESGNPKYDSRDNCNAVIETEDAALIIGCNNTTIPSGVRLISSAFSDCPRLTSITIPSSVVFINYYAFRGCSNLSSIQVESGNQTYDSRDNCNAIIETKTNRLIVGSNKTVIPNTVNSIGSEAFWEREGITSISIPQNVKSIESGAFYGCTNLSSISVTDELTYIGRDVFMGTSWEDNLPDGMNYIGKIAYGYKGRTSSKINITIKEGTLAIAGGAFSSQTRPENITSITLPNSVKTIGEFAFDGCTGLTKIELPENLQRIGDGAFSGCTALTSIRIPNGVTTVNSSAFANCSNITSVIIGTGITDWSSAFSGCEKLSTVELHCQSALNWYGVNSLKKVIIGNEVNTIDDGAFQECENLVDITMGNKVTSIGEGAFYQCKKLPSISLPNSLTTIGGSAFGDCELLKSIDIPNGVTTIGGYAFEGCSALSSITLGSGITSIGSNAFEKCGKDLAVTFHNKQIGNWFKGNSALKKVIIGSEVTFIGYNSFRNCDNLESISVDAKNTTYDSRDNCNAIIETASNTLYIGCGATTIPSTVTTIGDCAFQDNKGLTTIHLPKTLKNIGYYGFNGCTNLKQVSTDSKHPTFVSVNSYTFSGIASNATLTVPKGRKSAYASAQYWKTAFPQITESNNSTVEEFVYNGNSYRGDYVEQTATLLSASSDGLEYYIPTAVSYEDISYQVVGMADNCLTGDFDMLFISTNITSVAPKALAKCKMKSLVWTAKTALPAAVIDNTTFEKNGNGLLYITNSEYAPSNVRNVVVDSYANDITLSDDGGEFYCPMSFTAGKVSYTHNYTMPTLKGTCQGWETLALPFDVKTVRHEQKGEIIPMANYVKGSDQLPFWLYSMNGSSFVKATQIKANVPYILSMPNDAQHYDEEYFLAGKVTFEGENTTINETTNLSGSGNNTFIPTYKNVIKAQRVYALNVQNDFFSETNGKAPGSCFVSNLRNVRPFEAYIKSSSNARVIDIDFSSDDVPTHIDEPLKDVGSDAPIAIFALNGIKVATVPRSQLASALRQLPSAVYIVNGKKISSRQ